jgi:hypothetical protein
VGVEEETLERRRGKKKIAAKGIYTATRLEIQPHAHFVKTSALRWVCVARS